MYFTSRFNVITFANDLINPKGKRGDWHYVVTGFLSEGYKVSDGFCKEIKRDGEKYLSCF